ncbi:MAG: aminotransferase class V-fold PLP-dependent enzyme, partial [Actinobacteria bacterium]|nr:aminotransferase class V-fold PLP-dependent enzyme [Actinomycetota bacterium]
MNRRRFSDAEHAIAPYAEALRAHAAREPLMFMVPSHAGTPHGLTEDLAEFFGERAIAMDIPQLISGIDVGAGSPFEAAERLAADAWGARRTWFLANGSSQGNRLAVLAVAGLDTATTGSEPGAAPQLIAQRSAHSSLSDGLILSGLGSRFVTPSIDHTRGINHGLSVAALEAEFARAAGSGQRVCAAQIVSPSYFGAVADVAGLAEVAHRHGVPLIVDAAWGAHFGFHEDLPESPARLGADVVVTSAHKMGGSLGQSALIHLGDGPFADALEPLIDRAFRLTQTTSASSLLLGSLDVARRALVTRPELLGSSIELAERLRTWVRAHERLALVSDGFSEFPDIIGTDPLRVAIDVSGLGLTGYEVRALLAERDGILLEIATSGAVVAFLGPGKPLDIGRLQSALDRLSAERRVGGDAAAMPPLPDHGPSRLTPRDAYFSPTEVVPANDAVGRISADSLAAYPPGIPNLVPGEVITAETVEFLRAVAASPI